MANLKDILKKLDTGDMTPNQQLEILSQVEDGILQVKKAQAAEQQTKLIEKNVDFVISALKTLENKLELKRQDLLNNPAMRGLDGKDGKDGKDGRNGIDGRNGKDGAGHNGRDGSNGLNGKDGLNGISVTDARVDFDGSLVITLSDGREIDAGTVFSLEVARNIHSVQTGGTGSTSQVVLDAITAIQATLATYGTMATQNANNVAITGGSITGVSGVGTVTSVSGTAPVSVATGTTTPVISMAAATTSVNGYLTSTDWTTFNNKQAAGSYLTSVTSDAPLTGSGTSASHLSIPAATASVNGYLTSTNWATFNNKAASGANTDITSVALTTGSVTTAPSSSSDIVNKTYADSIATGVNFHAACQYATTAALSSNVYNNGSSGVGATLTGVAFGALTIDGTTQTVGNRVLVKNEVATANNGIYTVTTVGTVASVYVLTRATDYDSTGSGTNEIDQGDLVLIISGTTNTNTSWVQQTALPITIGTTGIVFVQFAAIQTYTAGTGLTLSTNQFSITNTAVTAASYTNASITVNSQGQLTSASSGTAPVTTVTGTAPVVSSGGTTPAISMAAATTSVNGYLTSTDWTTFNNKGSGSVTSVSGTGTVAGLSLSGTVTSSGSLTLGGTLNVYGGAF